MSWMIGEVKEQREDHLGTKTGVKQTETMEESRSDDEKPEDPHETSH